MTMSIDEATITEERPVTPPVQHRQPGRGRRFLRGLRTFLVVVALLAGAAAGGVYIVRQRLQAQSYVDLGTAMLTADPVPVGSPNAAVVRTVKVGAQSHVSAGQVLAILAVPGAGTGQAGSSAIADTAVTEPLKAPVAGTVATVDVSVGGVVKPGESVLTLYDQSKLTFQADVPVDRLKRLRLGMTATIDGPGLSHRITATLARIVPRVADGPLSDSDRLTVVLVPQDGARATVSTLVPGLPYTASVDTRTSTGGTPAVNSAG